jgi:hypothetical protein
VDGFIGGRRQEDKGRRIARDNLVSAAQQRQVYARRLVVRRESSKTAAPNAILFRVLISWRLRLLLALEPRFSSDAKGVKNVRAGDVKRDRTTGAGYAGIDSDGKVSCGAVHP